MWVLPLPYNRIRTVCGYYLYHTTELVPCAGTTSTIQQNSYRVRVLPLQYNNSYRVRVLPLPYNRIRTVCGYYLYHTTELVPCAGTTSTIQQNSYRVRVLPLPYNRTRTVCGYYLYHTTELVPCAGTTSTIQQNSYRVWVLPLPYNRTRTVCGYYLYHTTELVPCAGTKTSCIMMSPFWPSAYRNQHEGARLMVTASLYKLYVRMERKRMYYLTEIDTF